MRHKNFDVMTETIYEAAIKLFKINGFEKTKISDICKEARVPVGSIYHYYSGKEDFLKKYAKALAIKGQNILNNSSLSDDAIEVFTRYYIYKSETLDEAGYKLCYAINDRFNNVWMTNYKYNEYSGIRSLEPFLNIRAQSCQLVMFKDSFETAWIIQSIYQGCISYWLQLEGTVKLVDVIKEHFLPFVLHIIKPKE